MQSLQYLPRSKSIFILAVLVLVIIPYLFVQATTIETAFLEDFSDGELTSNPSWNCPYTSNYGVVGGMLHSDGAIIDGSGRYLSICVTSLSIQTVDYLEISHKGLLKSVGNPQSGRGTHIRLGAGDFGYDLRINRGFTNAFPTDSFVFSISANPNLTPLIVYNSLPNYDQLYEIKAVRQSGVWTLYVDGVAVGSAGDPLGINNFSSMLFSSTGSTIADDIQVRVQPPNAPPDCSNAAPSISTLWPPNHKFKSVNILGVTDSDGDSVSVTISSIFQDEPVNGSGDGDQSPDGQGVGSGTAVVRSERAGSENGRVYHIGFTADDGQGGTCDGEVLVSVPKSQGNGGAAVDDGPLYDSTQP